MANKPKMQLSKVVSAIPEALSIYFNNIVYGLRRKGYDITTLSLGEAYFDLPLFDFSKLDPATCYHYSESRGLLPLRKRIAQFYSSQYGVPVDYENELLISAGSKPLIFMAMQAVLNRGDEGLIHEPAWLSYQEQLKLAGAKPKFIPYDEKIADFHKHFGPRTRMLVINNPNNPAGFVYSRKDLESLYRQCRAKGIYLLVDEAYSDFTDSEFHSIGSVVKNKDGVIILNSLSKNMGMSGLRVGYVIAEPAVITQVLKLNQHLITCASTIVLHYLARYFDDIINITLPQVKDLINKRNAVKKYMDKLHIEYLPGTSTFYFFINIGDFRQSSHDFCLYMLLKHNISLVPGGAYGKSTERFVRLGIGTEPLERIYDALQYISTLLDKKSLDSNELRELVKRYDVPEFKH